MCVAIAPAVMAGISMATAVAGTAISAYGMYSQGQDQKKQANYQQDLANRNAVQAEMQADHARTTANAEADAHRRKVGQTAGSQRAALAASGVDISDTDSSAMNILADTAQWGEYDSKKIEHGGEMQAWGYENQAANDKANAQLYGMSASNASTNGAIGAGASLLSGAGNVANKWYTYKN